MSEKIYKSDVLQLLSDTGINPFAVKLLVESFKKIKWEVKKVIPTPLVFTYDGIKITLEENE